MNLINKTVWSFFLTVTVLGLSSCWKRYDTYMYDKVVIPPMVKVQYNTKDGYKFTQAGYECKFIGDPSPPFNKITFYKIQILKNKKPVVDLAPTIQAYFLEGNSKNPTSIASLSNEEGYPGWYKGLLSVKIGGVYKFEVICKDKKGKDVINQSFNIIIHNIPSEKDFKTSEKERIEKENKEFKNKKAKAKVKSNTEKPKTKEKNSDNLELTPAERYAIEKFYADKERYEALKSKSASKKSTDNKKTKENNSSKKIKTQPDKQSK